MKQLVSRLLPPRRNTAQSLSRTDVANANCCLARLPRGRNMSARLADWRALPLLIFERGRGVVYTAIARSASLRLSNPYLFTTAL
jgi:hypothetical protein